MRIIWLSGTSDSPVSPTAPGTDLEEPPVPVPPDTGPEIPWVTPTPPADLTSPFEPRPPDTGPEVPWVSPVPPPDFSPPPEPFPGGPA